MGWRFDWVSSYGSDFNYDYQRLRHGDERAAGKTYYNYERRGAPAEELPGSACSTRMRQATYFIPIRHMHGATTS